MPAISGALPASADDQSQQANVSFARSLPEKGESGNLLTYKIVVRNNGAKLLKLVDIDEAVPADHTVHSTEPPAEVHDQALHWAVRDLRRMRRQRFRSLSRLRPPNRSFQQSPLRNPSGRTKTNSKRAKPTKEPGRPTSNSS